MYYQAMMCYYPHMHQPLFSYLKNFCTLVQKFKFDNCYLYDVAFRTQIASQSSMPNLTSSVSWDSINDDLFNIYLRDNYRPSCFHCQTYGQLANHCPYKPVNKLSHGTTQANPRNNNFRPFQQNPYTYIANHSAATQQSATNSNQHTSANNTSQPCNRFNRTGFCRKPPCQNTHLCNKCFKPGHPGFKCFM